MRARADMESASARRQSFEAAGVTLPDGAVRLATAAEFRAWCARSLPDACACFFSNDDTGEHS